MSRFFYTADIPMLFHDLTVGEHEIFRATVFSQSPGSTVILQPGDVIDLPDDYEHAWLRPEADDGHTVVVGPAVTSTADTLSVKELRAKLDELGADRTGVTKRDDLIELLNTAGIETKGDS